MAPAQQRVPQRIADHPVSVELFRTASGPAGPALAKRRPRLAAFDDDGDIVSLLQVLLVPVGPVVTTGITRTIEEALAVVEREKPDVVITDLHFLGTGSGIDLARQIREKSEDTVLILLSASVESLSSGDGTVFDGIVRKPFGSEELVQAIQNGLRAKGWEME